MLISKIDTKGDQTSHEFMTLLNIFPLGIFILDEDRYVLQANNIAEQIIKNRDGFYLSYGKLRILRHHENNKFQQLVSSALKHTSNNGTTSQTIMSVQRTSCNRALEILIFSYCITLNKKNIECHTKVIVVIRDPDRQWMVNPEWLKTLYGLTPAEAEVAGHLSRGQSVGDLAKILRVQPNTIRIHLKHIYQKTMTRSQSELVNLVSSNILLRIPLL